MFKQTLIVAIVVTAFTGILCCGQNKPKSGDAISAEVDKLFEPLDKTSSPGCALAIIKDSKIIYKQGYGMADLEHNIVIQPNTVFHVASMSKQFTAAAIVLLEEEGKLSFDDQAREYIPELPDFGVPITIRELLHHTSGVRDQWDLLDLAGWRGDLDLITDDDILTVLSRQKALNFTPNSRYMYSNSNYTLLAQIVKRVSGKSLREFTTERIFQPLGMTNTYFRDDHSEIVKNLAIGYEVKGNGFMISIPNFDTVGATSLLTTVEDLALWDENFYNLRVGGQAIVDELQQRGTLSDGEHIDYALGLEIGSYRGLSTVDHSGTDAGYQSDMIRFPGQHFTATCLCNLRATNPSALNRRAADIYLDRELQVETQPHGEKAVQLSEQGMANKVGIYLNLDGDQIVAFQIRKGKLEVSRLDGFSLELDPLSDKRFQLLAYPAEFAFEGTQQDSSPTGVILTIAGQKPQNFDRVAPYKPSSEQLAEYIGKYRSEEVNTIYKIDVDNEGGLRIDSLKMKPSQLHPVTKDLFAGEFGSVRFARDPKGRVSGFVLNTNRIRNFRFNIVDGQNCCQR